MRSFALYVVTDEVVSGGRSHLECARGAIAGGADVVQLREKERPSGEILAIARDIRAAAVASGTLLILNDRLDIALAAGADGVHLGQDDLPVAVARRIAPRPFLIGASVGCVAEALRAEREGADYVAVSPVYSTVSKVDAGPGHGLETVASVRGAVRIPVIGIGGIGPVNAPDVIGAGADGCAVISAVLARPDVAEASRSLREIIVSALEERRARSA
ncbi:MAG: thiamine phosphate synthase [Methanospirillum sp.]|nr:thiamine phosphate synthase [Methanospirillum sp.]